MKRFPGFHTFIFFIVAASVVPLIGCEDPSSVGLGLVDDEGGDAQVTQLPLDTFMTVTANTLRSNADQTLAGRVDDPLLGTLEARGYVDFLFNSNRSSTYQAGPVDRIVFRIDLTYAYGDTLEPVTLALYDILEEFEALQSNADSLPALDVEVTQFTIQPTDTVALVEMPEEWVTKHDATFRSTDFTNAFHGLHIAPVSGNAVVGLSNLSNSQTSMLSIVADDTVSFASIKGLSLYERLTEPTLPPDQLLLQSGSGPNVRLDFDLSSISENGLNRAVLRLSADSLSLQTTPNFHRPINRDLVFWGIFPDSTGQILGNAPLSDDGFVDFTSVTMRDIFQAIMLSEDPFDHYEIRSVTSANTLNPVLVYGLESQDNPPQMILTITPFN